MAKVCRHHKNTLAPDVIYKIHPAIGVARVGKAAEYFIGPEIPGKGPTGKDGAFGTAVPSYKSGGLIKRQAVRFRIWKYQWNDVKCQYMPHSEVKIGDPGIKRIRWTVRLANRKASFFEFHGTNGEMSPYSANKKFLDKRRNPDVLGAAARRDKLEIDPDPVWIEGPGPGPIEIKRTKAGIPIDYLGELRTDDKGRLLVLGGTAESHYSTTLPRTPARVPPWPALAEYANNVTWFDDISDGEVTVEIQFTNNNWVPFNSISGAWVLVGPPDFAPPVGNVVTLYDTLLDVALRHLTFDPEDGLYEDYAPGKGLKYLKKWKADFSVPGGFATLTPSFTKHIYPILKRLQDQAWVTGGRSGATAFALPFHRSSPMNDLASLDAAKKPDRDRFFGYLRAPVGMTVAGVGPHNMPKLLGDDEIFEPGRAADFAAGNPREFLSLTGVQYALLKRWAEGNFDPDGWPAVPPTPADVTPEGLDRAALESCVGGAFFPGIEVGWLIRNPKVFGAPFRIDPYERNADGVTKVQISGGKVVHEKDSGGIERKDAAGKPIPLRMRKKIPYGIPANNTRFELTAGYFSQQMAQPWQADFLSCNLEPHGPGATSPLIAWWPGQRPDTVTIVGVKVVRPWDRGIVSREDLIARLDTRGFVQEAGAEYLENEGPPP